jgi:hypothetical protein
MGFTEGSSNQWGRNFAAQPTRLLHVTSVSAIVKDHLLISAKQTWIAKLKFF